MKFNPSNILLTTLFASAFARQDTGSLDSDDTTTNNEDSNFEVNSLEAGQSSLPITTDESTAATIRTQVANSQLVQTTNVINTNGKVNAGSYAVGPSTTIITTDEQGQTTTKLLWWIPETTAPVSSVATIGVSNTKHSSQITSKASRTTNILASSTSTRNPDDALTTVTGVNSLGETYTSKIWWLPSTATATSIGSETETEETNKIITSYSKSLYLTTSGSKVETLTTSFATTFLKKELTSSSSGSRRSTNATIASENGGYKNIDEYRYQGLALAFVALFL
ncbi:Ncw2p NDAI_0E04420 [Naumovozyma dairenensis CBS 421]|uniref:Uncharacterized protein n=1 Tax=Naumovozyma dairenensis (strain ATCC 10597 / BCRC 20456 / CBS 421 / NBRC 0211 / NRRL Y-12639) TaxID=1071378 RepID=G0WBY9_NAUDC|nr:hypothetical protein NDAI_0E04420 [Naumovozyma dairenensis CBS 421]CCD25259.1 hypothetical protein NDAI_0E04420 [Naumovozyma dairenensis CBS 421]